MNGYRFIPEKWSFYAYEYIVSAGRKYHQKLRRDHPGNGDGNASGAASDRNLRICAFQKNLRVPLLFYKGDHDPHAVFRRYDRQLPDRDQGTDAQRLSVGADPAPVSEFI